MQVLHWDHHFGSDKPDKAMELFGSALHKQINNDLNGAIGDYLAAIKIRDNDPAVHWYLGTAYEAAGKATEAKQEYEKVRQAWHWTINTQQVSPGSGLF